MLPFLSFVCLFFDTFCEYIGRHLEILSVAVFVGNIFAGFRSFAIDGFSVASMPTVSSSIFACFFFFWVFSVTARRQQVTKPTTQATK